jgi:AcrR family transcriptional regulator
VLQAGIQLVVDRQHGPAARQDPIWAGRQDPIAEVVYLGSVPRSEPAPGPSAVISLAADPAPDRRSRRRAEGRQRVFRAAVELFIERGFDATTMDEIADRADVARATVFNYFQRKTAFLDEWSAGRRQYALAAVRAEHLDGHPLPEILNRYMAELARLSTRTRAETVALMGAAVHSTNVLSSPPLAVELATFISSARDAGQVRADVDPDLSGLLVATGYFAILTEWITAEPAPFDLEARLREMVSILGRGLSSASR